MTHDTTLKANTIIHMEGLIVDDLCAKQYTLKIPSTHAML